MEGIFRETEVVVALGVLGESFRDQLPESAHPEKRHEAKRKVDVVLALLANEPSCAVGNSKQHSQQGELVGGGLLVFEHNVAEQWKRPGAVVGEPEPDHIPRDTGPFADVLLVLDADDLQAVFLGQPFDLARFRGVHGTSPRRRSLTQAQHHAAARTHQGDELAESPTSGLRRYVRPHRAQPYQLKGELRAYHVGQRRELIIHPLDRC